MSAAVGLDASVGAGADEKLSSRHCFWFIRKADVMTADYYEKHMQKLGTFGTIREFWSYYDYLVRPSELPANCEYHLFREGIKPMWEDPANKNGGKWILHVKKSIASWCWETLILTFIGDNENLGLDLCGLVCSTKPTDDVISVWTKDAHDDERNNRVRHVIQRVLGLPPNSAIYYRPHDQQIKKLTRLPSSSGDAGDDHHHHHHHRDSLEDASSPAASSSMAQPHDAVVGSPAFGPS